MLYEGGQNIDSIRSYMITVMSAAAICTVINKITEKQGAVSAVIKIISGLFLAISVLSPVLNISFEPVWEYFDNIHEESSYISDVGIAEVNTEKEGIIKSTLEAYILDKAKTLGLSIEVTMELNNEMIPVGVKIHGSASPYAKRQLEAFIADTLGIPKEDQSWM